MKIYIKILRLTHQLFCLLPILVGSLDAGVSLTTPAVLTFMAGFAFASTAGFAVNDYVDSFDTDQFSPEDRSTKGQKLDKKITTVILIILSLLSLAFFYLSGPLGLIVGIFTLALMFSYSTPPLRLKRFAYLEFFLQFVAWLVVPYFAAHYLTGTPVKNFVPFLFFSAFMISASSFAFIMDIRADKKAGIFNTTATLGYEKSLRVASNFMFAALVLGLILVYKHQSPWYWLMLLPGFKTYKSFGRVQSYLDQPKKMQESLLHIKKQGKLWGFILFGSLVIFILLNWQHLI